MSKNTYKGRIQCVSTGDNGETFKYGKVMGVVRLTYFGCHHHMLNQESFVPENKQAPSSIFIVPKQHSVNLTRVHVSTNLIYSIYLINIYM